ncbi:MAG TPA: LLM class flavin-dependent oxidoreductase [Candidatus Limnocylindrales bacterium]|nr:LLM class flavin-dependent oxidoreductase [Candidatus Limnocylindrales bacterium]
MKVGLMLAQSPGGGDGGSWSEISALARLAEEGGADSLWVSDHLLYRPGDGTEAGYHEAWTLLAALAATTSRVEIGALVLATSFRPPGLLARMTATLDDVAGGRLILGLGCGWHEPEYSAFGYPFDHRVGRFDEQLQVIVPLLRGERVTLDGRWTKVEDAVLLPPPRQPPTRVLVAAKGRRMLRLTARYADLWQTAWFGLPDERWRQRRTDFLEACAVEGRDPAAVGVTVGVEVGSPPGDGPYAALRLDTTTIAEGLAAWREEGVDHVQIALAQATSATFATCLEAIDRFRD